jgi:glucose-1-phosphate cytidylyltransferase
MKAVIVAGGFGTRMTEESVVRPKPMVEIGGQPILWHIMKIYAAYGVTDFIVCCGYKSDVIKSYFVNYAMTRGDVTIDFRSNSLDVQPRDVEPWCVSLVETGGETMTGGRLKRVRDRIGDETFHFTYGDCVTDVDLHRLVAFHRQRGTLATLTAVQPPGRFGALSLDRERTRIRRFVEKPNGDGGWVNGGFFVLEPGVMDFIEGDSTVWEQQPLQQLAKRGELSAYRHYGYWQNMDTIRDRMVLESQWASDCPPWKVWG